MSVDIKCLSIGSLIFTLILNPMTPFFLSPHPMTPFFPLLYQILQTNCKFLHAWCTFWEIYQFCGNFNIKFANFGLKLHFCLLNDPKFWKSNSEKIPFFLEPTLNDPPFFQRKLTTNAPYFHSLVGTCRPFSYLSAPPPPRKSIN